MSADTQTLTEEEQLLADSAGAMLAERSPVSAWRDLRDAGQTWDPQLWAEMAQLGWTGVLAPEAAGGSAMGHTAAGVLARAMGETLVASPFISTAVIAATALRTQATDRAGDRAMQHLASIVAGDLRYALAVDETHKHDPANSALEAQMVGNRYRLNGAKSFVVDAGCADRILVLARTAGSPGEREGLTLFDLDASAAGLQRNPMDAVDGRDAGTLQFNDVEASADDIIGEPQRALHALQPALQAGQAALAAELCGLSAGAFGMTVSYLQERKQFGRTIGSFQTLQHRAAQLWCDLELTTSAIRKAGRVLDGAPDDAGLFVSLAKARATSTARLAVSEGVQMHGGIGMTDDFDMGFYMKRARVGSEWLGDYSYHAEAIASLRGF